MRRHSWETRRKISQSMRLSGCGRPRKPVGPVVRSIWAGKTLEDIAFDQGVTQQAISSRIARWGLTRSEIDALRYASDADKSKFLASI